MKRLLIYIVISTFLFSCVQHSQPKAVVKKEEALKPYKAIELVDTLVSVYPNLFVNDIQNERFLQFLHLELDKRLSEDNSFLYEIPVQFSQMLKKGNNKYILKFECGKYSTDDKRLKSEKSKTEINYAIFTEVDADFASTLENNALYMLKGRYKGYVNGKLRLPSGKVFNYNSNCYKTSSNTYGSVCLGGFLFDNISVKKTTLSEAKHL